MTEPIETLTLTRRLPHSIEAEMALLGAILVDGRGMEKVGDFLRSEHFSLKEHRLLFEAIGRLNHRGRTVDAITLKTWLMNDGSLEAVGGTEYLSKLAEASRTVINVTEYGALIHDLAVRRELIALGEDLVNRAYQPDPGARAIEMIEQTEQALFELADSGREQVEFTPFRETLRVAATAAEKAYKRDGALPGVTTGLRDVDGRLGGLHPSDLVILAGRPGMGKTALATNMAFAAAKRNNSIGFFSLEMSKEQLATRVLGDEVRVSSDKIRRGLISWAELERVVGASTDLGTLPIFIDDSPGLSMPALRSRARRLKRRHGLGMLVIDYLQLIGATPGRRQDNRVQELSEITRGLKCLAKELHVPVLALSQLSRQVESREDKRPQLSDLRESGTIEQDADVVMFIYREQYYLERAEPTQRADESEDKYLKRHQEWMQRCERAHNLADVMVAKQRHGPIGTVKLRFEGEFTRFSDLDRQSGPQE